MQPSDLHALTSSVIAICAVGPRWDQHQSQTTYSPDIEALHDSNAIVNNIDQYPHLRHVA